MPASIKAMGDTIKIDKKFTSGKDRITVNDDVVFEGKFIPGQPQTVSKGEREYLVESKLISKMTGATSFHLTIRHQGELLHEGLYDQTGKPVNSEGQAKAAGAIQACGLVGGVMGFALMMFLNKATGVVPGGAIGGALGGGLGGAIGYGFGTLIFGGRK